MSPNRLLPFQALAGMLWLSVGTSVLHADGLSLDDCSPRSLTPGGRCLVTFRGRNVAEAELLPGFQATIEPALSTGSSATNQDAKSWWIRVGTNEAPGMVGVRARSRRGVTEPLLLTVDPCPNVASTPSHLPAGAPELPLPAAVEARSVELQADHYRIRAAAGQRLVVEVMAQRLGSAMDPVLTLRDAQGRELAYSDDDPGLGNDARLEFTFTNACVCQVEVHDVEYRGGLFYRLRVGPDAVSVVAFPCGARPDQTSVLSLFSTRAVEVPSLIVPPEPARLGLARVGSGASSALVYFSTHRQVLECEPNDEPDQAREFAPDFALSGRLQTPRDVDRFRVRLPASGWIMLTPTTAGLGSPAVLRIEVLDDAGVQVAASAEGGTEEEPLRFRAEAGRLYQVVVRDLFGRGGPGFAYHLLAESGRAPFSLALGSTDRFPAAARGVARVTVNCTRRGFDGPITLKLSGTNPPVRLSGNVIGEKQTAATVLLEFPAGWGESGLETLALIGEATVEGRSVTERVSTGPLLRQRFPELMTLPTGVDGRLYLSKTPEPFCVSTTLTNLTVERGGRMRLPVFISCGQASTNPAPVRISLMNLPPGVKQEKELVLSADQHGGEIMLIAEPAAPLVTGCPVHPEGSTTLFDQPLTQRGLPLALSVVEKTRLPEPVTVEARNAK